MTSDDTIPLSLDKVWYPLYEDLEGSPWEANDLASAIERNPGYLESAAHALKYAYDQANNWTRANQDTAVNAVLTACSELDGSGFIAPVAVRKMTDNFSVLYEDMDEAFQDYLNATHEEMPLSWLGEYGRSELKSMVCAKSEIWLEEGHLPGVWVFKKPHTVSDV